MRKVPGEEVLCKYTTVAVSLADAKELYVIKLVLLRIIYSSLQ
jgi:hypothetical protein